MKNNDVVIVEAIRSPIGKFGGALKDRTAPELIAPLIKSLKRTLGKNYPAVQRLILGNVYSAGEGQHIVRQAARLASLPENCPTHRTERVCTSSLQALWDASLFAEKYGEVIIAGGMESMSRTPYILAREYVSDKQGHTRLNQVIKEQIQALIQKKDPPCANWCTDMVAESIIIQCLEDGLKDNSPLLYDSMLYDGLCDASLEGRPHMGEIADDFANKQEIKITREAQDEYAFQSYHRAYNAKKLHGTNLGIAIEGYPIRYDEGIRDPNLEKMRQLKPIFGQTITAGNASQLSDGAAALLVTTHRYAKHLKLQPIARIVAFADCAMSGDLFLEAPVEATYRVLETAGFLFRMIDLVEVHEPFAVGPEYYKRFVEGPSRNQMQDMNSKMNVWGGAIAQGHPLGATGAIRVVTLIHALRYYKKRYGLAVVCNGGGEAVAVIIENLQR